MDSLEDLLQLLRNYFSDDFLPTKILHIRHDTVKIVIFSHLDTVIGLKIERRNSFETQDMLVHVIEGLNALCLCPTFPYSHHDKGLTRDKVKNRPDSGVTVSIIVGPIPQTTFVAAHTPVDPKYSEADTFTKIFLTRHLEDNIMTEKILLSVHDSPCPFLYLCIREIALRGLDCSSFIAEMRGKLNVSYHADYKKILMD